jgi:hypothetical protein
MAVLLPLCWIETWPLTTWAPSGPASVTETKALRNNTYAKRDAMIRL